MEINEHETAKLVRLQNGDDLIATVVEFEDENGLVYALIHPLKAVYVPTDTLGYLSVSFIPWVFSKICDQSEFIIHAEDVLFTADVTEKMNAYYKQCVESYTSISDDPPPSTEEEGDSETMDAEELDRLVDDVMKNIQPVSKKVFH